MTTSSCEIGDLGELMPSFEDSSFACCVCIYPYAPGGIATITANQKYSNSYGMHREELFARAAMGEKPHLWTEIRGFIFVMLGLFALKLPGSGFLATYHRAHQLPGHKVKYQRMSNRVKLRESEVLILCHSADLSEEEHLAAMSQDTSIVDTLGLHFLNHIPDFHTETFEHLNATAKGRKCLDALATKILELFESAENNLNLGVGGY
eukprot:CAMPEP_0184303254 /NCGR_PEP_ID=MMETSP1049-20130417/13036_1 /TAXON_ID=77928 /ORGANISM="Proteomonas sulcata, Strain CCMP704" /LENGTH=206 /DNA_ID=CAMNT_0026614743 /DNA_START=26 /DNA_END=646 /DNA_ORIENTATION=+